MKNYEAIIIGTGFGGAINACRLSKKWPGKKVLVLERGKEYPMGSFPRSPHDMSKNFWNIPEEKRKFRNSKSNERSTGLFDIRNYPKLDVVLSAGLGGGSLIYANVFLEPPDNIFDDRWPKSCKKSNLRPYYKIVKSVLGSRPIPKADTPRRKIVRTELYQRFAKSEGRNSELADINVFFGNDFKNPTPIGVQEKNKYGAIQTSCTYCAECDVGCNTHSKNTLDLNYLFVARHKHLAEIRTEHIVTKIIPLGPKGEEDETKHGEFGYRVYFLNVSGSQTVSSFADGKRVVVSAGTLGTTELLLRCKTDFKSLPDISEKIGTQFSGNGDFLSFVAKGKEPADPNYGPVITQYTDYNLFKNYNPKEAFILEDASYPVFASYFVEGAIPILFRLKYLFFIMGQLIRRVLDGKIFGKIGFLLGESLKGNLSYSSLVLLCMGIDSADGRMYLDRKKNFQISWPQKKNMHLYDSIMDANRKFYEYAKGEARFAMPTWAWPIRNNVSVHPLGGCILGDSVKEGVCSADPKLFGQVFNYQNLYVADGSLVPTAIGANPSMTISALSERVAEGITGRKPDIKLA
ncbi:GMC oxidoreductase domain protein [Leptospira fainei serovar Hurstbridge str. BUT 6]|uniref:Cholesterol oxidase n=1 Tax=Leptospira fainei serovar Hurstbridge str. BUT 6 TaxID=1193011 RepID=S3VD18_9LEPT|nr:GMC oxidoreductase [Leptospira fainei]EPG74390.1 GMC oxidoreductase domain protein [Leptospira fainei serovar Hurstbridge str. BUT 6]